MRKTILGIALALAASSCVAQEEVNVEVLEIMASCDSDGYFVYEGNLFMCNFIRGNVTDEDLAADEQKQKQRAMNKWRRMWGIEGE